MDTNMTTTAQARQAYTHYALPAGPHTCLFNRELLRREQQRKFDAEFAKLTPANIAALEIATGWLIEGGYPVQVSA